MNADRLQNERAKPARRTRFTICDLRFTSLSRWLKPLILTSLLFVAGIAPAAALQTEWATFPALEKFNGRDVDLDGLLYRPFGKGPFPALVLMHGCSGMYSSGGDVTRSYLHWAELLAGNGYVTLLVDSFNPRGYSRICELQQRPIRESRERVQDAYAALRWLEQRAYVAKGRIGLLGWSNGGTGTLYAMRSTGRYRGFRAAVAFYPGCRTLSRSKIPYTTYAPTLILTGEADDWTPARYCVALASIAKTQGAPLNIVTYPGAHHAFDRLNLPQRYRPDVRNLNNPDRRGGTVGEHPVAREKAIKRTLEFFGKTLKN